MCVSFSDMAFLLAMDSGLVNPMAQSIECLTVVPEDLGSNPKRGRKMPPLYFFRRQLFAFTVTFMTS